MLDDRDKPPGERFPRSGRILKRRDFLRVQKTGKRVHTPHFVIIVLPAPRKRLGITVTKRVAGSVGRNRIRRVVREVYRHNRDAFPDACEIVFIARHGSEQLGYAEVEQEVMAARTKLAHAMARAARPHGGEA